MEQHHDPDAAQTAEEAAAQAAEQKHPARPEQIREGFETGYERDPDAPQDDRGPNFARGLAEPETDRPGRFSEGIEQQPDDPENGVERRFSEGIERNTTSE